MPRPKGYVTTKEERERISAGVKKAWDDRRRPWAEILRPIQDAMEAGDRQKAHRLIDATMDSWEEE